MILSFETIHHDQEPQISRSWDSNQHSNLVGYREIIEHMWVHPHRKEIDRDKDHDQEPVRGKIVFVDPALFLWCEWAIYFPASVTITPTRHIE